MSEPSQITAIKPTQRDPSRATVRVAGRVVATLPQQRIAELELEVGMPWTDTLAASVSEAAVYDKALRQAMNRLARRGRSRSELDRKLAQLGYEPNVRERVLDRLTELNFLDDDALGRALMREIQARKPAGPHLLRQKLRQKGLDRELVDRLVAETRESQDQAGDAADLLRRRLPAMARLDPATRKRRLYSLLARRGFDGDAIQSAFESLADEMNPPAD
ncbi:regulatory protein RecX [Phycisphaerales bacterium AB-hyl4]|uniref:Regulatory protein RecX n=1 Tax=Natronomicrosphaera hydrolytica TaxID=3242702 RepID=A0ABV4UA31_9BACT